LNVFTILVVLLVLGVLGLLGLALTKYFERKGHLSRAERDELVRLRTFYRDVDEIAIENRDVDPTAMRLDLMIRSYRLQLPERNR
jgi:hypothetical protein